MSQIHKFDTISIQNNIKTNMQACLAKNGEMLVKFDISRGFIYNFALEGRGLIERGV